MGTFEVKKDKKGQFFWTIRSKKNGEAIAKSSESYATKASAMKSIQWMRDKVVTAEVSDMTVIAPAAKKAAPKKAAKK